MTRADLVKRLRTENALAGHYGPPAIQVEAADRIEALEREVRRLNNAARHLRERCRQAPQRESMHA